MTWCSDVQTVRSLWRTLNRVETENNNNKKKFSISSSVVFFFHASWCTMFFRSTFPQYSELQIILMRALDNTVLLFMQKKKLYYFFKRPFYGPQCLEERRTGAAGLIVFIVCVRSVMIIKGGCIDVISQKHCWCSTSDWKRQERFGRVSEKHTD